MLISVLVPFKNETRYLKKTLDSIVNQTEQEFELIAVDDYSTDDSLSIVQGYSQIDSRIKIFSNKTPGVIEALDLAYTNCSGQLITRHDADDVMPSDKLEELKKTLLSKGRGFVATGLVKYFSDETLGEGFVNYANWLNELCEKSLHKNQLFKECVIASGNWMAFREDLELIDAFTESILPEDYHLVFKMFEHDMKVVSSNKITHLWRDHALRASRLSEHYKDQKFYPLKIDFFTKLHGKDKINLWGAGPSGKKLAKVLIERGLSFHWVTNNQRKIGKTIYGIPIHHFDSLKNKTHEKLIISVTQKGAVLEIINYLKNINLKEYFEF